MEEQQVQLKFFWVSSCLRTSYLSQFGRLSRCWATETQLFVLIALNSETGNTSLYAYLQFFKLCTQQAKRWNFTHLLQNKTYSFLLSHSSIFLDSNSSNFCMVLRYLKWSKHLTAPCWRYAIEMANGKTQLWTGKKYVCSTSLWLSVRIRINISKGIFCKWNSSSHSKLKKTTILADDK